MHAKPVKQPRPTLSARILDWLAWKLRGGPAKPRRRAREVTFYEIMKRPADYRP